MTVDERVAALRALADDLEVVAQLSNEVIAAKAAYRNDPTPENKRAKDITVRALTLARTEVRNSPVRDVRTEGQSMSITPVSVGSEII